MDKSLILRDTSEPLCFPWPDMMAIFQLVKDEGLEIREKRITRDEVYIADEAFFTGSAAEVTLIRELDDRAIGSGLRGPITEKLQSKYFDLVHGRHDKYEEWLAYV